MRKIERDFATAAMSSITVSRSDIAILEISQGQHTNTASAVIWTFAHSV